MNRYRLVRPSGNAISRRRGLTSVRPVWRPAAVLDEWVQKEARPISLRQLTFFGRSLTESRLISSANYVRTELPVRIAHRIRDMQTLPFSVVSNPNLSHVYELYYKAFDTLRAIKEIKTLDDNDRFCTVISETLQEHLTVIPRLAIGVLECTNMMQSGEIDRFMSTLLRARISRRVIAEQHLALTETFNAPWHFPEAKAHLDSNAEFVGEVFLRCDAREVIESCGQVAKSLVKGMYDSRFRLPDINIKGDLETTFPYILNHLEYIIGELLRNSIQAVAEHHTTSASAPPPIEVLICEAPRHVIIRVSDQGGGIPGEILPDLWSFSKGPRSKTRLDNLSQVPRMAATMQELKRSVPPPIKDSNGGVLFPDHNHRSSRKSLTSRPPNLRLGMGLPMSRIYAEYWAGSLEIHNLEGFGVDAFLQISKLGNKNEQLSTRASIDGL